MELSEILSNIEKLHELRSQFNEYDNEVYELQDKIDTLELEMDEIDNLRRPIRKELEKLEWEMGIRVSKDQLRLFDTNS